MAFTLEEILADFVEVEQRWAPVATPDAWATAHSEYRRAFYAQPEQRVRLKLYMREYRKRPGVHEKIIADMRVYNARPDVKARQREWDRKRRSLDAVDRA